MPESSMIYKRNNFVEAIGRGENEEWKRRREGGGGRKEGKKREGS